MTADRQNNSENKFEKIGDLVSIFQRGRPWYANYQIYGKQFRRSLRTTSKKQARSLAVRLEADLLSGRHQQRARAPSIAEVIDANVKFLTTEGRSTKTIGKCSSWEVACWNWLRRAATD